MMKRVCYLTAMMLMITVYVLGAGLEYSFEPDHKYNYNLKYGEEGAFFTCRLQVACVKAEIDMNQASSVGTQEVWTLVFAYEAFDLDCKPEEHKELQLRYREVFTKTGRFEFSASVDKFCNIQHTNLKDALMAFEEQMKNAGMAEDGKFFCINVLLPLIAGTWRTVFPGLPESPAGLISDFWDRREWSVFGDPKLESLMRSAETGCRFNVDRTMNDDGNNFRTVIWISVSERKRSSKYGGSKELAKETAVELCFDHTKGIFEKGSATCKTVRKSEGDASPFVGIGFVEAKLIP